MGGQNHSNGWTESHKWVDRVTEMGGQNHTNGWTESHKRVDRIIQMGDPALMFAMSSRLW